MRATTNPLRDPAPTGIQALAAGKHAVQSLVAARQAAGSIVFAANPANNDTVTINGVVVTFKTSGAAGNQVNLGGALTDTIDALVTFLNASANGAIAVATYSKVSTTTLRVLFDADGAAGNAFTLAASLTTPASSITAVLAGGANGDKLDPRAETILVSTLAGEEGHLTFPDGDEGQERTIFLAVKGSSANLKVSAAIGSSTTATFDAVGDCLKLKFLGGAWRVIVNIGSVALA